MTQDTLTALSEYVAESILKKPGKPVDPQAKLISTGQIDIWR